MPNYELTKIKNAMNHDEEAIALIRAIKNGRPTINRNFQPSFGRIILFVAHMHTTKD